MLSHLFFFFQHAGFSTVDFDLCSAETKAPVPVRDEPVQEE